MRKVFTIMVALTFALVGCDRSKEVVDAHRIGFASQMNRALVENAEDLRQQELLLYGAYTLDGSSARVFDAEHLYYNAELPGWDYAIPQYWISGASYRFSAVSPYDVPCTFSDISGRISITGYEGHTDSPDLLYATAERDLTEQDDFSTVFLRFRHACAALQFNIINASSQVLEDVRNIRLVGIQNCGNFSFSLDGVTEWYLDGTTISPTAEMQPYAGVCTLPEGGLPVNLSVKHSLYDSGAIIVLPQSIYKTTTTLHLEYIKAGDAAYSVRDIELGMLSSAIAPTEWKANEKYEYNLTITDNTITAEVKVVDWVDHYVDL